MLTSCLDAYILRYGDFCAHDDNDDNDNNDTTDYFTPCACARGNEATRDVVIVSFISRFYVVAKWNICHNALTTKSYCTNRKIILHQPQSAPQARLLLKIKELATPLATLKATSMERMVGEWQKIKAVSNSKRWVESLVERESTQTVSSYTHTKVQGKLTA